MLLFIGAKPWTPTVRDTILLQADGREYHEMAISLLQHGDFSVREEFKGLRTPVYPFYVMLVYGIAGPHPWVVLLTHVFIDTLSCYLLFLALQRLFGRRVALLSALFYALDPFLIYHCCTLYSDSFFVFVLVTFFYFFSRMLTGGPEAVTGKNILYSALALGIVTLTKPITLYFPALVLLIFLLIFRWQIQKVVRPFLVFLLVFLLTLSPWIVRNYLRFGHASLSNSGDYNTLAVYVAHMEMNRRGSTDLYAVIDQLLAEGDSLIRKDGYDPATINPFEKAAYYKQLSMGYIKRNPLSFGKHIFLGMFHEMFGLGTHGYSDLLGIGKKSETFSMFAYPNFFQLVRAFFREKSWGQMLLGFFIAVYVAISYGCVIYGSVISWRKHKIFVVFCLLAALYFIVLSGAGGWTRYKLPAIPFYLGLAGLGLDRLLPATVRKLFPSY
jgi:4-amino-4-deoxy-L-arabinose transferase-like glycosyltransferase